MKPKILYFLTADTAIQENETKKYTVVGIFDMLNIAAESNAVTVPTFVAFLRILNTKGTNKVSVIIEGPDGNEFKTVEITPTEPTQHDSLSVVAEFQNTTFTVPGQYKVKVKINEVELDAMDNQYLNVVKH